MAFDRIKRPGLLLACGALLFVGACPVEIPTIGELPFACEDDRPCAVGYQCRGGRCVPTGTVVEVDGAAADGAARDAWATDGVASDRSQPDAAVHDATVPDTGELDAVLSDLSALDSTLPDSAFADAALPDSGVTDVVLADSVAPDAATPDAAAADTVPPDSTLPDAAQLDAAGPSTVVENLQRGATAMTETEGEIFFDLSPAVDPDRSILFLSVATDSAAPTYANVSGQIVDSGARVRFKRHDPIAGVTVSVAWTVVQLDGVLVQRGTETMPAGSPFSVQLPQSVDLARAFPLFSLYKHGIDFNSDDWLMAEISDAQTLTFSRGATNGDAFIDWQVVELQPATGGSVQHAVTALASGNANTTADLGRAVDLGRSFLIFSNRTSGPGGGQVAADQLVRGWLSAADQISFNRGGTSFGFDMSWYVVSWDALTVQRSSAHFDTGVLDHQATLSRSVNPRQSAAFCPSFQHRGETTWAADDSVGNAWFTAMIAPDGSALDLHRAAADDAAEVSWTVVEFQ